MFFWVVWLTVLCAAEDVSHQFSHRQMKAHSSVLQITYFFLFFLYLHFMCNWFRGANNFWGALEKNDASGPEIRPAGKYLINVAHDVVRFCSLIVVSLFHVLSFATSSFTTHHLPRLLLSFFCLRWSKILSPSKGVSQYKYSKCLFSSRNLTPCNGISALFNTVKSTFFFFYLTHRLNNSQQEMLSYHVVANRWSFPDVITLDSAQNVPFTTFVYQT